MVIVSAARGKLISAGADLTQPEGLPDRPGIKHMIYALGLYMGYAVQSLSALEDSLVAGDWPKMRSYAVLLCNSLITDTNTTLAAAGNQQ